MRKPDVVIGPDDAPYMRRWWLIPRNRWFNVYLHEFLNSDDPRARHDHPWWNCSIVFKGGYWEDTPTGRFWRGRGSIVFRKATALHILELDKKREPSAWTLFLTGPVVREWGFVCPRGWRHWKVFTNGNGKIGQGCGD